MKGGEYSASQLRERTDLELRNLERTLYEDLFKLRLQRATNQLENVAMLRKAKRDLARVRTILRARELQIEASRSDHREESK